MKNNDFVSVIIPMYNSKDTIKSAIESVLNQTYKEPIEIIVVNDGSKDGCEKIVEEMILNNQTNRVIKLINKENGGVSSARNRGIKEASGKYIDFLDIGDVWHPQKLELVLEVLREESIKFLGHSYMLQNKTILVNSLGIQDSGGITVLDKLLYEIAKSKYKFLIVCNKNKNILNLIKKYSEVENFEFLIIPSKGFLHRLYFENIVFRKMIKEKNIDLVYNFSGSSQFFSKVPQMIKVHNLLFYSKKLDKIYFENKKYIEWFKQVFIKRFVFHKMIKQTKYIEVQSNHVKEYISDFINISSKQFFIKSDIDIKKELFQKPKNYDFTKKLKFFYIVGPHFEYLHKNFEYFVNAMLEVNKKNIDFEIIVTLTKKQLHLSSLWDKSLDDKTVFLGYLSKDELKNQFQDNTILISTSVIETLGLHVIESVQNGILSIVPNEKYSFDVYGKNIITYDTFNTESLVEAIKNIILLSNNEIKDIIKRNQQYFIENENKKFQNIVDVFDKILKENINV